MNVDALAALARRQLPRMLTQVCRDPESPFFGCWDRNWWHYKIRDFPSIILQQGGYALYVASKLDLNTHFKGAAMAPLIAATARFWTSRALRHGAFEEYYPYEQGYPPLAFSTLAIAKLGLEGIIPSTSIRPGLKIAANQLLSRFEAQAANQQVAGTAAVAAIRKIAPDLVAEELFSVLLDRTLALQDTEGWFPEYDGPDLGYLSVTMDCLWDLYDFTGDVRCRQALGRALAFTAWFVLNPPHVAGMLNARNTDYFVPYALARLAAEPSSDQPLARAVFERLYTSADSARHFFAALDDRYWCHYIGHSLFRALSVIRSNCAESNVKNNCCNNVTSPLVPITSEITNWLGSGYVRLMAEGGPTALVATRKGGATLLWWHEGAVSADYGWIVRRRETVYVSHWWSLAWKIDHGSNAASCKGVLVEHHEHGSAPWKHIILRLASFAFGMRLIPWMKRLLIFKKSTSPLQYQREVIVSIGRVVFRDRIVGLQSNDEVSRAPRSSKRHVASADSFHAEDLQLLANTKQIENISRKGDTWECLTEFVYSYEKPNSPLPT